MEEKKKNENEREKSNKYNKLGEKKKNGEREKKKRISISHFSKILYIFGFIYLSRF